MSRSLKILILACIMFTLSGCCGTVQYRDRYAIMTPNDSLLVDYDVDPPPLAENGYAALSNDEKETMWVQYTTDLLVTVKKHMSDKAGLRKWKSDSEAQIELLNKEAKPK